MTEDGWNLLATHLHRAGAWAYYWTVQGQKRRSHWWKTGNTRPLPPQGEMDVYFGIHPVTTIPEFNTLGEPVQPSAVRSQLKVIAAINCLFGEYDAKHYTDGKQGAWTHIWQLELPPSVVVDSGGGYHAYWLLGEPFLLHSDEDREYARQLQYRWIDFVGSDKESKDLARVLRVPGTRNYKPQYGPDFPTVSIVYSDWKTLYTLDELESYLPETLPSSDAAQAPPRGSSAHATDGNYWLNKALDKVVPGTDNGREGTGFWLACQLRDNDFTESEARSFLVDYASRVPIGDHPYLEKEALASLARAYGYGAREPARNPNVAASQNGHSKQHHAPSHIDKETGEIHHEAIPQAETLSVDEILDDLEVLQPNNPEMKPDSLRVETKALELVEAASYLNTNDQMRVVSKLRQLGLSKTWLAQTWQAAVKAVKKERQEKAAILSNVAPPNAPQSWPYKVTAGRIMNLRKVMEPDGGWSEHEFPVCDFTASIVEEVTTESGDKLFVISGQTVNGRQFRTEMDARDFSDERKLKATLEAAAGAKDPVRAGMAKHLGPAIKLLPAGEVRQVRRYDRTGWEGGHFLIPGRALDNTEIYLPRKLPYFLDTEADLGLGLEALDSLLKSLAPERTTVALAALLQGPLALLADWRGERYCLFIKGRTGSFKTEVSKGLMTLYGADHQDESRLIKWGEGATRNSVMGYSTHAHDLPMLIDNYKPSTGGGSRDFINLIHNILEGSEKDRLNRSAELRESRPIYCWPICTGEDVPDSDPASLARALVLPFEWQRGEANPNLTHAQGLTQHMSAVGNAWIEWIEGEQGQAAAKEAGKQFAAQRDQWATWLRNTRPDMVNIMRVASNLASNQLTWQTALKHPIIGQLLVRYTDLYRKGLEEVALLMAESTAEALEATRYLAAVQELITTGRCVLLPVGTLPKNESDRERNIGWRDTDGTVYLLPDITRQAVDRLLGGNALGGISASTLNSQLEGLGVLLATDKSQTAKVKKVAKGVQRRVLFLKADTIELAQDTPIAERQDQTIDDSF